MNGTGLPRAGVLCAGTLIVDVGKVIDAYPALDHLAMIEGVTRSTGGAALNMAVDLRMLGAGFRVGLLGSIGADGHGAFLVAECERLGIDVTGVRTATDIPTSFTDAMVERHGGRRTFFHYPGANTAFRASGDDLRSSGARILHIGAPGIHPAMDTPTVSGGNAWVDLLEDAGRLGFWTNMELVSLEPADLARVAGPCLAHLDSIVINDLEAAALTSFRAPAAGQDDPVDWVALEGIARRLIELGVRRLAVVHFPGGAVAAAPGGEVWRQGSVSLPENDIRSTTGAGDAFAAGVVLGIHERWPVEQCLRLGSASAAASLRSLSTSEGIQSAETCLRDAERAGYRSTNG